MTELSVLAPDVWPGGRRDELHDRHPPAARDDDRGERHGQTSDAPTHRARRRDRPREREGGQDEIGLEVLGQESEPDERCGEDDPAQPSSLERPDEGIRGDDQEERQQRIGVVVAEDQDRGRRERRDKARDDGLDRSE